MNRIAFLTAGKNDIAAIARRERDGRRIFCARGRRCFRAWLLGALMCMTGADWGRTEPARPGAEETAGTQPVVGTTFRFHAGELRNLLKRNAGADEFRDEFLRALTAWIAQNVGLPQPASVPRIEFSSLGRIAALRSAELAGSSTPGGAAADPHSIIAIYDNAKHVVHLPEKWAGDTPRDLSILVHELTHFIQDAAGLKYACPQAREEAAYRAQQKWLALSGRELMREFDFDPFTLLVRTLCAY